MIVIFVMLNAEFPVFVNVAVWGGLFPEFTRFVPKFRMFGTILTVPDEIVIVAPADLVVSVTEVAMSVTVAGEGTVAGAVGALLALLVTLLCLVGGLFVVVLTVLRVNGAGGEESGARIQEPGGQG